MKKVKKFSETQKWNLKRYENYKNPKNDKIRRTSDELLLMKCRV